MLVSKRCGQLTVEGYSLGGVYTTIGVPELSALFDCGLGFRRFVGLDHLFLSHAHADHVGGLVTLLGLRGLAGRPRLHLYCHRAIVADLEAMLAAATTMQRYDLGVDFVPLEPGETASVKGDLHVRAIRTFHPVPSLAFELFRPVKKLRAAFAHLEGPEIAARKSRGEDLFDLIERSEMVYATDTLSKVLRDTPSVCDTRVLVLECTFVDDRKSRADSRAGCHIHLDDLLEEDPPITSEHVVLMHASQLYSPEEYRNALKERAPERFRARVVPFVPDGRHWPL